QPGTPGAQEERRGREALLRLSLTSGGQDRAPPDEIRVEGVQRGGAERHHPLLRPLADDAHRAPIAVEVRDVEAAQLGYADGGRVEQLEDGVVAQRKRVPLRRTRSEFAEHGL